MARGSARERWRDRFRRWQRSGTSAAAFCRAEGVSETSFYAWRRRLEEPEPREVSSLEFVELQTAPWTPRAAIELVVDGVILRLAPGVQRDDLRTVLEILRERP